MTDSPILILASASSGRAKLLADAGIAFDVVVSDVDETAAAAAYGNPEPVELALLLARAKAEAVATRAETEGSIVLGCDSVFELDGEAYGKPYEPEIARERWQHMRGNTGTLHTGHWLIDNRDTTPEAPSEPGTDSGARSGSGATIGTVTSTSVTFAQVTDEEIAAYVATGEPLLCAGGFTIDGRGGAFVTEVTGNPHAVVGLSISTLRDLLGKTGLSITDLWV